MRSMLIGVLGFVVMLLMVSSCATVPTEPPAPGEVRLLGVRFAEVIALRQAVRYMVEIKFESDGQVDVSRACFYWDDHGPYCYNIIDVTYGKGIIRTEVATPAPGRYVLKSYVHYTKDGRPLRSNVVQTSVEIVY